MYYVTIDKEKILSLLRGFVVGKIKVDIVHLQTLDGTLIFQSGKGFNIQWLSKTLDLVCIKLSIDKSILLDISVEEIKVRNLASAVVSGKMPSEIFKGFIGW